MPDVTEPPATAPDIDDREHLLAVAFSVVLPRDVHLDQVTQVVVDSVPRGCHAAASRVVKEMTDQAVTDPGTGQPVPGVAVVFAIGVVLPAQRIEDPAPLIAEIRQSLLSGLARERVPVGSAAILPVTPEVFDATSRTRRRWFITGGDWAVPHRSPFLQADEPAEERHTLGGEAAQRVYDVLVRRTQVHGLGLPGSGLPRYADLMVMHEATIGDVAAAVEALERDGLVWGGRYRVERTPVRVVDAGTPGGRTPAGETVEVRVSATIAVDDVAARLEIAPGSQVMRSRYVYFHEDVPVREVMSWEPLALTGGTAVEDPMVGEWAGAGVKLRMAHIGRAVATVEETVYVDRVSLATTRSELLRVPVGGLVLVLERTCRDARGTAVETSTTYMAPERNKYRNVVRL